MSKTFWMLERKARAPSGAAVFVANTKTDVFLTTTDSYLAAKFDTRRKARWCLHNTIFPEYLRQDYRPTQHILWRGRARWYHRIIAFFRELL